MTVAKLIELLEKVKDKSVLVFTYQNNFEGKWFPMTSAAESEDEDGVYIA